MPYKGRRQTKDYAQVHMPEPARGEVIHGHEYGQHIKDDILLLIVQGEPLKQICARENFPSELTVARWMFENPQFEKAFINALRISALLAVATMQWIADGNEKMLIENTALSEDGEEITTVLEVQEDVQRSALRVKVIQWRASRLQPKIFGDRAQNGKNAGQDEDKGELTALIELWDNQGHKLPSELLKEQEEMRAAWEEKKAAEKGS